MKFKVEETTTEVIHGQKVKVKRYTAEGTPANQRVPVNSVDSSNAYIGPQAGDKVLERRKKLTPRRFKRLCGDGEGYENCDWRLPETSTLEALGEGE